MPGNEEIHAAIGELRAEVRNLGRSLDELRTDLRADHADPCAALVETRAQLKTAGAALVIVAGIVGLKLASA